MHRRRFLQASAIAGLSTLPAIHDASAQMRAMPGATMGRKIGRSSGAAPAWPTGLPLNRLRTLASTSSDAGAFEGTLVAAPYAASMAAGGTAALWGYNREYPGPLVEVWEGERVSIDFENRLSIASTIH